MKEISMECIDIDLEISAHSTWRRQFLNAFAAGSYAAMPLSDHRGCVLGELLAAWKGSGFPGCEELSAAHDRFHALANDIIELSENGLGGDADLLLPQLTEAVYRLVSLLDQLRASQTGALV